MTSGTLEDFSFATGRRANFPCPRWNFGLRIGSNGFLMTLLPFVRMAEKRAIGAAVSAAVLHTAGRGFESLIAHHRQTVKE